jgi:NAD/NADP transhydrogenase alpha subunit
MTIRVVLNVAASKAFIDRDTRVKLDADENGNMVMKGTWREDNQSVTAKIGRMPSGAVWFRVNDKMMKRLSKRGITISKGRMVLEAGTHRKLTVSSSYNNEIGVPLMNVA